MESKVVSEQELVDIQAAMQFFRTARQGTVIVEKIKDITEERNRLKEDRKTLTRVLLLLTDNLNTSNSRSGLARRLKNNMEAYGLIRTALNISEHEADDLYWNSDFGR